MPQRPSQTYIQDRRGWHREISLSSGDPEIEDDWILVHQATNHKRPSLTSFFPEKGKGDREKVLNSLSGFDCSQASSICLALLTPPACGAASLMARCATPDVGHPILPELVDCDIDNIILGDPALFECLDNCRQDLPIVLIEFQYSSPDVRDINVRNDVNGKRN
jgi:hypothetical protein